MTSSSENSLFNDTVNYTNVLDIGRRSRLAEFCRVKDATVRGWAKGKTIPLGVNALVLHHLLVWVGYDKHKWPSLNTALDVVGKAVAFGLLSEEDLINAFNHSIPYSRIIQMLSGHKHVAPESQSIFDSLANKFSDKDFRIAQSKWSDLRVSNEKEKLIVELAGRLQALLPLVKDMASDKWNEGDRYALRDRAGVATVFDLYVALGELCGERARAASIEQRARQAAASFLIRKQ